MSQRRIEDVKVFLRERPILYKAAKILHIPIELIKKNKKKKKVRKETSVLLEKLNGLDKNKKHVFYFGVPMHGNLGDTAQTICTNQWINDYFTGYEIILSQSYSVYDKQVRKVLQQVVMPEDIFIMQSGAVFGNKKHVDHGMHRYILKHFRNNRVLFMPVTVDFSEPEELVITKELFVSHERAFLLTRDKVSYERMCELVGTERVRLFPDIVTTLIGRKEYMDVERHGILFCKRTDGEKVYADRDIRMLMEHLKCETTIIDITDTDFEQGEKKLAECADEVEAKIKKIASYEVVVTDRFHGMVFSMVANTPVVVIPTNTQKVREGAKWFKEYYPEAIFFCETLDEAEETVKELLRKKRSIQNISVFKEMYYDKLKEKFEQATE